MVHERGVGISGHNFDAFVSSQRSYNEPDFAAKIQEKYWRARQKFLAKIEKKEDQCIVLSDAKLDSKLEIYRSIDRSCERLADILASYQNCLFVFANEENALGILLKECAKHDKTKAGKIMALTGKSLNQSSHQRIRLYMPLLRLYQEMETFHSRAVEDTSNTVDQLERRRSQYRASLLWMKDISEQLDPDVYKQLDKFRRVQNKVRDDKRAFDGMQMDVVQKIDLLMASRCNLINQTLAPYQSVLLETFEKNHNNFQSVEEIIKGEDLYEYEFKTLKQLNPLRLDEANDNSNSLEHNGESLSPESAREALDQNLIGDLDGDDDDQQDNDIEPSDRDNNNENNNNAATTIQDLFGESLEQPASSLIDVNAPDAPAETAKTTRGRRLDPLLALDGLDENGPPLTSNPVDVLETLFGSSHGAAESRDETSGGLDQDLMDIFGNAAMPESDSKGLDDFLA